MTPCQFYTSIMELVERSRFANRDDSATMESLDSFQAFARRQFEVLSLVDEACHTSLLAVVAPATPMVSTESSPPPVDDNGKASKVTPHRGLGCCKNSREKPPPDNLRELLAADALNMIRDGSSSVGTSQVEADSKQAEGDEPEATSSPAAQQPQPVGHPSPTPPLVFSIPVPKLESCPAISVPEGCGLDSTSVSAALDKATMLLQTNDVNSLLPVKDLGLSAHASKPPTVPLASTTVPATRPVDVHTLPATSLAMPFTLVPTSGVAPLQQVFLPVSKVGSVISGALDASNLPMKLSAIPISIGPPFLPCKATPSIAKPYIPAGTESWYPAYMAWVYSGMVSSGIQ